MDALIRRVGPGGAAALLASAVLIVATAGLSLLLVLLWTQRKAATTPASRAGSPGQTESNPPAYILVPGKRLEQGVADSEYRARLATAAQLWHEFELPVFISGAACDGSNVSEAGAGEQILVDMGVPPESIQLEEAAAHSYENIAFLSAQLRVLPQGLVVSNRYHLPRLLLIAKDFDLAVIPVAATATGSNEQTSCARWLQEAFYIHWFLVARLCRQLITVAK